MHWSRITKLYVKTRNLVACFVPWIHSCGRSFETEQVFSRSRFHLTKLIQIDENKVVACFWKIQIQVETLHKSLVSESL